jgi:hypothetical protein
LFELEYVPELEVLPRPRETLDTDPALTSQERATATLRKDTEPDGELTSRRLEEILIPRKLSGLA